MQTTFGYNAVSLRGRGPRTLSLLELVRELHALPAGLVTRRRSTSLRKAEERAHVLRGYLIALDNLEQVIALIRGSADTDAGPHRPSWSDSRLRDPSPAILDSPARAAHGARRAGDRGRVRDLQRRRRAPHHPRRPARIDDALIREELLEIKRSTAAGDDLPHGDPLAEEGARDRGPHPPTEDMVHRDPTRSGYVKRLP